MSELNITALVVTFNRKESLLNCLAALERQTLLPTRILIIDNASTDGTYKALESTGILKSDCVIYHRLEKNTGGAGGFSFGLDFAINKKADWVWMMDDDALPDTNALYELMNIADDPTNIFGSTPVHGNVLSWGVVVTLPDGSNHYFEDINDMPDSAEVVFLPFLGILIHRQMVEKIGLPDAGFFIAADDVEYTLRAKKTGAKLIQAGKSRIEHPSSSRYQMHILGRTIYCLRLPPWKRYYDTRNRLLLARRHYGMRLYSETIPGSLVRFLGALLHEPQKGTQMWAFIAGFIDGLLGYKGMRHLFWGISP
jgi:GT2 family glycosyltransferase